MTLYSVPSTVHIYDINVNTAVTSDLTSASVAYVTGVDSDTDDYSCTIRLFDAEGEMVELTNGTYSLKLSDYC